MSSLWVCEAEFIVLSLRFFLKFLETESGTLSILDNDAAVNEDRLEVRPGSIHNHRLDRIDELAQVKPPEIKNCDIRLRAGIQSAEIRASQGFRSADRCSVIIIRCGARHDIFINDPAQHDAGVHVPDEVRRKSIGAQSHIDIPGFPFCDRVLEHGMAAADEWTMDDRSF